jgi:hypothetical protein
MHELRIEEGLRLRWERGTAGWSRLTIEGGPQPVPFTSSTALVEDACVAFVFGVCAVLHGARAAEWAFALEPGEHRFALRYLYRDDEIELTVTEHLEHPADEPPHVGQPVFRLRTTWPALAAAARGLLTELRAGAGFARFPPDEQRALVHAHAALDDSWAAFEERMRRWREAGLEP